MQAAKRDQHVGGPTRWCDFRTLTNIRTNIRFWFQKSVQENIFIYLFIYLFRDHDIVGPTCWWHAQTGPTCCFYPNFVKMLDYGMNVGHHIGLVCGLFMRKSHSRQNRILSVILFKYFQRVITSCNYHKLFQHEFLRLSHIRITINRLFVWRSNSIPAPLLSSICGKGKRRWGWVWFKESRRLLLSMLSQNIILSFYEHLKCRNSSKKLSPSLLRT